MSAAVVALEALLLFFLQFLSEFGIDKEDWRFDFPARGVDWLSKFAVLGESLNVGSCRKSRVPDSLLSVSLFNRDQLIATAQSWLHLNSLRSFVIRGSVFWESAVELTIWGSLGRANLGKAEGGLLHDGTLGVFGFNSQSSSKESRVDELFHFV